MSLTPGGLAAALGPHTGTLEHLLIDDCFRTAPASAAAQSLGDLAARHSGPQLKQGGCSGGKARHAERPMHSLTREAQAAVSAVDPMLCNSSGVLGWPPVPVPDGLPGQLPACVPAGASASSGEPGGALAPLEALVLRCQMLRSLRYPDNRPCQADLCKLDFPIGSAWTATCPGCCNIGCKCCIHCSGMLCSLMERGERTPQCHGSLIMAADCRLHHVGAIQIGTLRRLALCAVCPLLELLEVDSPRETLHKACSCTFLSVVTAYMQKCLDEQQGVRGTCR